MSDVHSPSDEEMSPVGSVTSLRQRFEMIGQGVNGTTDRPSSPQRPASPQRKGPPRPPPPVLDRPRERRTSDSPTPSSPESPTTPKSPARHTHHGARAIRSHPLEKSKSKSVEELDVPVTESEASEGNAEEGGGKKKGGKKEKNKKQKLKEEGDRESSGKSKFHWRLKGHHKSSSSETKESSPKTSPEHSSKKNKKTTAAVDQSSPEPSSKAEASASPPSTEGSGKKESAELSWKKTELRSKKSSPELSGKRASAEPSGKKTPSESKKSPEGSRKKEPAEATANAPEASGHQKASGKKHLMKSESVKEGEPEREDSGDSGRRASSGLKKSKSHLGTGSGHTANARDMASTAHGGHRGGRERASLNVKEEAKHAREAVLEAEGWLHQLSLTLLNIDDSNE